MTIVTDVNYVTNVISRCAVFMVAVVTAVVGVLVAVVPA